MCTTAPTKELSPTPVTAPAGSTPAFCMKRTFNAMPPTLAGVIRLTNDDAIWASTVGTKGSGSGTLPTVQNAAAMYVTPDRSAAATSHPQLADLKAVKLSPTLASWGSKT